MKMNSFCILLLLILKAGGEVRHEDYGSQVIMTAMMPKEFIAGCSYAGQDSVRKGDSPEIHSTEEWFGPTLWVPEGQRWKIAVTVYGKAVEDKNVSLTFCSDMISTKSANDIEHAVGPMVRADKKGAGAPFVVSAVSRAFPVRDSVIPYLGIFAQRNAEIDSIRVSVVSGFPLDIVRKTGFTAGILIFLWIIMKLFGRR